MVRYGAGADERIARLVIDALFHHDGNLYTLLAFVVMPNHVHVVLTPLEDAGPSQVEDEGQAGKPAPQLGSEKLWNANDSIEGPRLPNILRPG